MKNTTSGTLQVPAGSAQAAGKMRSRLSAWLERENRFFSSILEETVTNRKALWIAGSAVSFSATLLFCMAGALIPLGIALIALVFTARRGELFYKEGGQR